MAMSNTTYLQELSHPESLTLELNEHTSKGISLAESFSVTGGIIVTDPTLPNDGVLSPQEETICERSASKDRKSSDSLLGADALTVGGNSFIGVYQISSKPELLGLSSITVCIGMSIQGHLCGAIPVKYP
uniref:Uncharacterized protein n=1 Tax=Fibrocapsa japonica TaxID=94617 RepID=A0A7S2XWN5_9STRA|mmetsp:Transcript_15957/g.23480  ORF Transcript_15957/g.23480 Transcript_15957/m.23480 type:complete len:130 (+) Transcript_15957:97-486(+)|eukprot:CAMPEP_0113945886 /NCGR_PEP_ID=MMETSP1339-20121228/52774_1 /TAXON_ID=94617 /ORGANISM="Fibrocapsa japonica" /LENGTH=129 /DNA_ID=CAMNT_0000951717 /DNA_START=51 /DNA_END=440 /DNA_ORIENTATION=+ /assembly_acc=CAM_ASM_000762